MHLNNTFQMYCLEYLKVSTLFTFFCWEATDVRLQSRNCYTYWTLMIHSKCTVCNSCKPLHPLHSFVGKPQMSDCRVGIVTRTALDTDRLEENVT
jgi:hypothetical protein